MSLLVTLDCVSVTFGLTYVETWHSPRGILLAGLGNGSGQARPLVPKMALLDQYLDVMIAHDTKLELHQLETAHWSNGFAWFVQNIIARSALVTHVVDHPIHF
jgi:hypothetical protein